MRQSRKWDRAVAFTVPAVVSRLLNVSIEAARLAEEIRDNLEARIIEAKREGWLGEVEGLLQVSYSGVEDKLSQIDASLQRRSAGTDLGMPALGSIAGRSCAP